MKDEIVRELTLEQCEAGRARIVAGVAREVAAVFRDFPDVRSAVLMVGQFWADEAIDAVHRAIAYSFEVNPDFAAYRAEAQRLNELLLDQSVEMEAFDDEFESHDLWLDGRAAVERLGDRWSMDKRFEFHKRYVQYSDWDSNGSAIPLFAAYCEEGADQELPTGLSHAQYAVFRRGQSGGVDVEVVGVKVRPWLEGVAPQKLED
jgi:hypothetical protein